MLSKNHKIYEVCNEWAAESVFVDHKRSRAEIEELVQINEWDRSENLGLTLSEFIVKYIHVERLGHFYVSPICKKCSGNGYYSYSTNPRVKCTDCKGTGHL